MRSKQNTKRTPVTRKRKKYTKETLAAAWKAVEGGMSIYKASRLYGIPKQTLGDRKAGRVRDPTNIGGGKLPLFQRDHEKQLVSQIKYLAGLGYGYSSSEVLKMATDYAHSLSVLPPEKSLTKGWVNSFYRRWPEINSVRSRRTKEHKKQHSIPDDVKKCFIELKTVMDKYDLHGKPHCIYSVDEIIINVHSKSGKVVPVRRSKKSANTNTKHLTASVVACGNAIGSTVPPLILLKGKEMPSDLSQKCTPGTDFRISETPLLDKDLFMDFIENHFLKFTMGYDSDYRLLLYDGYATDVDASLTEWAKQFNVILFVLPTHAGHLPLDIGCFGHFRRNLQVECEKITTEAISKEDLVEVICKSYPKAFCYENLVFSYKKTGIYPFDSFDSNEVCETAEDNGSPAVGEPADEDQETGEEETEPMDEDSESADGDSESEDENAESVDENAESADENVESADENAESADGNAESVDENVESADGNAELVNGNAELANGNVETIDENAELANGNTELANGNTELEDGNASSADGGHITIIIYRQ